MIQCTVLPSSGADGLAVNVLSPGSLCWGDTCNAGLRGLFGRDVAGVGGTFCPLSSSSHRLECPPWSCQLWTLLLLPSPVAVPATFTTYISCPYAVSLVCVLAVTFHTWPWCGSFCPQLALTPSWSCFVGVITGGLLAWGYGLTLPTLCQIEQYV